jgi:hypothetical protein
VIEDFRDILAALVAAEARFLVVGAHALAAHGVPRMTSDLDLLVEPTPRNAQRVWQALVNFGAPLDSLMLRESDFTTVDRVVQLGVPPWRIDIMTGISGVSFSEAWDGRMADAMLGVSVAFIGREAFIRNKRASGRSKDLIDIDALQG